jgi:hypothetical protein
MPDKKISPALGDAEPSKNGAGYRNSIPEKPDSGNILTLSEYLEEHFTVIEELSEALNVSCPRCQNAFARIRKADGTFFCPSCSAGKSETLVGVAQGLGWDAPPSEPVPGIKPDNMLDFGASNAVQLDFLDGLRLPASGIATIGARTSGGKTTVLINIMGEFLHAGKSVFFATYEMNASEIILALALHLFARSCAEPIPGWTRNDPGPGVRVSGLDALERQLDPIPVDENPEFIDLFSRIKMYVGTHGDVPSALKPAYAQLASYINDGRLAVVDSPGNIATLSELVRLHEFGVYIVDYIQIIPPPADAPREGYGKVAAVCDYIRQLGNAGKKLIVVGAQFNRQAGEETTAGAFDPRLEQFREAGDIEQISTLAIGIGYQTGDDGKKQFFYKILKNRFAGRMAGAKMASAGFFDFYYAQRGGRWTPAERWITTSPPRKLQGNQLKVMEIVQGAGEIDEDRALAIFKEATGKQKSAFTVAVDSLIRRGVIDRDESMLFSSA